ncbi:o-succinylbenzoate synthase [Millisia brevis]|uniref:o-succinylbenzoate synthase n=1 Tax=Millisia brevis TaxID=264148 RepID=UPI0009FFD89C|nr:o-succinylbenzoate synthase [Millisia brevis]
MSPTRAAVDELIADAVVVNLPMRVRFRGITNREVMLLRGPAGWAEFSPFVEYGDEEAARWLAAALDVAHNGLTTPRRERVAVNATVPAVAADEVDAILDRFPGVTTAKVKVAEPGGTLAQDVARVEAVRARIPRVRVDANAGWSLEEATTALTALTRTGPLEYAEQPCASVEDLVRLRRALPEVPIAADESIRKADDPLRVARAGAADVAVLKVAPLGGPRAVLRIADELAQLGVTVVLSSALDSAVGIAVAAGVAAALPIEPAACGLGTGRLFRADVVDDRAPIGGALTVGAVVPDPARLAELAAPADRRQWWHDRARRCADRIDGLG